MKRIIEWLFGKPPAKPRYEWLAGGETEWHYFNVNTGRIAAGIKKCGIYDAPVYIVGTGPLPIEYVIMSILAQRNDPAFISLEQAKAYAEGMVK